MFITVFTTANIGPCSEPDVSSPQLRKVLVFL